VKVVGLYFRLNLLDMELRTKQICHFIYFNDVNARRQEQVLIITLCFRTQTVTVISLRWNFNIPKSTLHYEAQESQLAIHVKNEVRD